MANRKKSDIMEKSCVHCGACTRNCDFLKKYQLDFGNVEELNKLAYHCFLCGKCKDVCPAGIDGREVILELRRKQVAENDGKIVEGGYDMLIKEKSDYIFRNYRNATSGRVLFTGCNFPSFFPKTTKYIAGLLKKEAGIGTIYDCCGKPIGELGLEKEEVRLIERLNSRLKKESIEEVIMLCPNCYYFLKDKLDVKVTGIFEILKEFEWGRKLEGEVNLYIPCPDKKDGEWLKDMSYFLPENVNVIKDIQCCGLGGCARAKEMDVSQGFSEQLLERDYDSLHTYCASCSGKFTRDGIKNVHHVLVDILETNEEPDTAKSMLNRTMSKLW